MCILSLNRVTLTFLHKIGQISVYFRVHMYWSKSLVTGIPLYIGAGTHRDTITLIKKSIKNKGKGLINKTNYENSNVDL